MSYMDKSDNSALGPIFGAFLLVIVGVGFFAMLDAGFQQGRRSGYCEASCEVINGGRGTFRLGPQHQCICVMDGQEHEAPVSR